MSLVVCVTGSRDADVSAVVAQLFTLASCDRVWMFFVGDCSSGADLAVRRFLSERGCDGGWRTFAANWALEGRKAGPERNARMIAALVEEQTRGARVEVWAFPARGAGNKGTMDTIRRTLAAQLPLRVMWVPCR